MFEKSFITDCEGPLTLNDNAFELCNHFIEHGGELFKILSLYDDYLSEVVIKEGYTSGNTLKLILPFFVVENVNNEDFIDFSKNNISAVSDSKYLLDYVKKDMNTYIVSTSYGQYIEALSDYMDFPFKNTYYTKVDMDVLSLSKEESFKIRDFKKEILENPSDYKLFNEIFFEEIPKMDIYETIKEIDIVGGLGKTLAIENIIVKDSIDAGQILYVGDSITDMEPLRFARSNDGIAISFNGNKYPLEVAEIAIISPSAIATTVIADIYKNHDKNTVFKFIKEYNSSKDILGLFDGYGINSSIKEKFFERFKVHYPTIKLINEDNFDEILNESVNMRNNIRGEDIGGLG